MMDNDCQAPSRPKTFREYLGSRKFLKPLLATTVGAVAGFLYYFYIGSSAGTSAISTNPYQSTLMGGFLGWFAVSSPCSRGKC